MIRTAEIEGDDFACTIESMNAVFSRSIPGRAAEARPKGFTRADHG